MTIKTHITTSGGLISAAFIENVREAGSRQSGVEPESFALPWSPAPKGPAALEETIATTWELLLERWDAVRMDLPAMDVSQVRTRWLLPLFQLLDFDPVYLRGDTVLDEAGRLRFSLSHRGWIAGTPGAPGGHGEEGERGKREKGKGPILHTVAPSQGLDERMVAGRGVKAKSPHDMLQAFLNASPGDRWAILSNGVLLRLLRDYHHTFARGYVQFDLESILETRNYGDFRALYRMAHASRFVPFQTSDVSETSDVWTPLEQFYKDSIATGIKVGEDLREQVRQAIEMLGNGFLDGELIQLFTESVRRQTSNVKRQGRDTEHATRSTPPDLVRQYYAEILHVVYRILFLLFAEQRGMMPGRDSLYAEVYAISALRARAEGDIPGQDDFSDLWEGLKVTFRMLRQGVEALGVYGYDGMLFDDDQTPLLSARAMRNSDLLRAIRALTLIEREGVLQRISYADLGVEELGSIYESLLDYTPRVTAAVEEAAGREVPAHTFFLDPRGSERKTTGSYYTHPSLVNELIASALLPVAWERLKRAGLPVIAEQEIGEATAGLLLDYAGLSDAQRAAGEKAILSLTVCDAAGGSGHFLVKADNVLGAELARIRSSDAYPTEATVQAAKRDVLAHCIYAVDLNPMAVELCKVSLWINASVRDQPLSFLDHHIKCGNSLIGATPELMAQGVPTAAFQGVTGDDRGVASAIRARNRQERAAWEAGAVQGTLFQVTVYEPGGAVRREYATIAGMAEDDPHRARERYLAYLAGDERRRHKLEADLWTAAFFWPLVEQKPGFSVSEATKPGFYPTHGEFMRLLDEGPQALPGEALIQIEELAQRHRFFHWHLEFPDVFDEDGAAQGAGGGFDVFLGNPPWERIKVQEKEFFADKDPAIAGARTAAARRRLIRALPKTDPALHAAYATALRDSEATSHFLRDSGRYPLTAVGDINTYQVFAGLARQLLAPTGRAGIVLPTGIATDYFNQDYFAAITQGHELVSLYDFENRAGLFPGVHRSYKFSLITLAGAAAGAQEAEYAFFMHTADELTDPERRFALSADDLRRINPNTGTCPVFRTRQDAELTRKLYGVTPVLVNETTGQNPWQASLGAMFHSGGASSLFRSYDELAKQGLEIRPGSRFESEKELYLPLYEGKMFMQYDHRAAQIEVKTANIKRAAMSDEVSAEQKRDASYSPLPRFWVDLAEVQTTIPSRFNYLIAFKKVTSPTNERTLLATILPLVAANDSIHLVFFSQGISHQKRTAFVANLNSLTLDFVSRQKLGGLNFNFWVLQQLPILTPECYTSELLDFIVPRVVELTYTAWDLQPFARDVLDEVGQETWARWFGSDHLGSPAPVHTTPPPDWAPSPTPPPFVWDQAHRARLRAGLDALYAHLYGLTRQELDYILETFPIVRRKDEEQYGEYRTKRMILEQYEALRGMAE